MIKSKEEDKKNDSTSGLAIHFVLPLILLGIIGSIGFVTLPSTGLRGVLRLLCMGILLLILSLVWRMLALDNIELFKQQYKCDKEQFKREVFSTIFYMLLWIGLIVSAIFLFLVVVVISVGDVNVTFENLSSLVLYIAKVGLLIGIPTAVFINIKKYWNKRPDLNKKVFKKHMTTIFLVMLMCLFIIGGANFTIRSIMDLACRSTENVILVESYVEENHQGKGGTSYTLTGTDKDGNKHSFSVEKNNKLAGASRKDDGLHISYYKYTKVIKI